MIFNNKYSCLTVFQIKVPLNSLCIFTWIVWRVDRFLINKQFKKQKAYTSNLDRHMFWDDQERAFKMKTIKVKIIYLKKKFKIWNPREKFMNLTKI